MMRTQKVLSVLFVSGLLAGACVFGAAALEPNAVVAKADVEKVAGGKWKERSPEPGVIFYEEEGGGYRQVNVYLFPPDGKTVAAIQDMAVQNGEPVEELKGLGDGAMYRPQGNEATVEKANKQGQPQLLSVSVHNAKDAAEAKKIAVELVKRGAAKL